MQHLAELKAGIFVLIAIVLFTLFVWVLGSERQMFAVQHEFLAHFKDIKGLAEGAPVRLGGITIGRVSKIYFSSDYRQPMVNVVLLVNEDYLERIRSDSLVTIETQGLLGDRFVNISMAAGGRPLPIGSTLNTVEPADIAQVIQKAEQIVDNTVHISERINDFLGAKGQDTLNNISEGAKSLSGILKEVETGKGMLHSLVYSEQTGENLTDSLNSTAADIREITREVREGDGLLHSLIFDKEGKQTVGNISVAARNVSDLSAQLSAIMMEVREGQGLAHSLIFEKSPRSLGDLLLKLNETADNFKKASESLVKGQGTLGALLIDPKLYENLMEITDSGKRSFLLRQAIKSSLSK